MIDNTTFYRQRLEQAYTETQQFLHLLAGSGQHDRWKVKQRRITHALERLRAGTFGYCLRCGLSISQERLDVLVYAEFCLSCQREREKLPFSVD